MVKKGDTLIEVVIAIGIFSLIAVSIVSVVSGSSSNAQTAIETTLAREEIDIQAEALRFIQAGYMATRNNMSTDMNPYASLWNKIKENAIEYGELAESEYPPSACIDLYEGDDSEKIPVIKQKAFVINANALGKLMASGDRRLDSTSSDDEELIKELNKNLSEVYVLADKDRSNTKLFQSSTYPRLIFKNDTENSDQESFSETNFYETLYRAEGIYVIAVKSGVNNLANAYYDFYIRSCWYGTGDDNPSTISTIVRLSDPTMVQ